MNVFKLLVLYIYVIALHDSHVLEIVLTLLFQLNAKGLKPSISD